MIPLLRASLTWIARHILIFLLLVIALVAAAKAYEAYRAVPALEQEVGALEEQRTALESDTAQHLAQARASAARLDGMEASLLRQRLGQVRAQIAVSDARRYSRSGFALDVVQGETGAIARELGAGFRLRLLQREEQAIQARLAMIARGNRAQALGAYIAELDARAAALERRIGDIERRHPILSRAENVPILKNLQGPWRELSLARQQLREVVTRRQQAAEAQRIARTSLQAARAAYQSRRSQMLNAIPPRAELEREIERRREALARHWTTWAWDAVSPVLGWALWITFLVIVLPPAIKALWFFGIAPAASRLRPIFIKPDLRGDVRWADARPGDEPLPQGSGVSRRLVLHPGDELVIKPEYLQAR